MEELTKSELIEGLEEYGYSQFGNALFCNDETTLQGDELKRLLCEIVGVGYHTPSSEVINLINERL